MLNVMTHKTLECVVDNIAALRPILRVPTIRVNTSRSIAIILITLGRGWTFAQLFASISRPWLR